ncbi:hypothetical protein [Salinisphaera sp. T31B1]|uniref:hypothetical protein n=1 Tax=Salinisphaera sp. T31B1 TaxID=727963 RepID=UPI003340C7B8
MRLYRRWRKFFEAHVRGKNAPKGLFETLNSLNAETEALTPPAISSLEASGVGDKGANIAVTKFQNLLHSASVNVVKRFAILPYQAGAYIGWLSDLITDVDVAVSEEPWQLVSDGPPTMLTRLNRLLETLRVLAGEAHERQEAPAITWAARGKGARAGNALKLVSLLAKAAGDKRLARRKAEIERSANEAGIDAVFHLRVDPTGILPWPPAKVLALLSASDVADAVSALAEQAETLRSLVTSSAHLTVMAFIDGIAFPALARSGHQTLFPSVERAVIWAEDLGLRCAPSAVASLFGEVLTLAGELGAMDRLGLGAESRPEAEVIARRAVETSFDKKREDLVRELETFELDTQTDIFRLIERLQAGVIDFAAEAQAALGGASTEIAEAADSLALLLLDCEFQRDVIVNQ